jgi:ArsR family transcriptional regulator
MSESIFGLLSTLSDPLRVRILHVLHQGEFSVGELTQIFQTAQSTMSRHLKMLHSAAWIKKRTEGTGSWFSFPSALLCEEEQSLWGILSIQSLGLAKTDIDKAKTLLSLRHTDSEQFFQTIKERWAALRTSLFGDQFLLPTLLSLLPSKMSIVDLGCGNGDTLLALAPHIDTLVGIDRSSAMLSLAQKRSEQHKNIQLQQGVLENIPRADHEFDVALCILVLHHVPHIHTVLNEIARILKPNGTLVILDMETHNKRELQKQMGHKHLGFSIQDFRHPSFECARWNKLPQQEEALGPKLFVAELKKNHT